MLELGKIKLAVRPDNILLVLDAMIGQDAVQTARSFNQRLGITGVVLTKLDGDARGGAALSVREVTGAPVTFVGVGEMLDKLELFRPDGMASRVLGMGDIVGLIQDFDEVVDQKKAEEDALRMMSGHFTLDDFLNQIKMIQRMGSLKDVVEKVPGLAGMIPGGAGLDDSELGRIEAMIQSMTRQERGDAPVLVREPSRVKRVARGSGTEEGAVNELVQKFLFMQQMMSGLAQNAGLMGRVPGLKGLATARQMRRAMKSGKFSDPAGMPGLGLPGAGLPGLGGLPGMMPGLGGPSAGLGADAGPRMRALSKSEKNARKNQRKRERTARKKGKGKK